MPQLGSGVRAQHGPILRISHNEGACIGQMGSFLSATWGISHHILTVRSKERLMNSRVVQKQIAYLRGHRPETGVLGPGVVPDSVFIPRQGR